MDMSISIEYGFQLFSYGFFSAVGLGAPIFFIRFMGNARTDIQDVTTND